MVVGTEYLPMVEYASRPRTLSQLISVHLVIFIHSRFKLKERPRKEKNLSLLERNWLTLFYGFVSLTVECDIVAVDTMVRLHHRPQKYGGMVK